MAAIKTYVRRDIRAFPTFSAYLALIAKQVPEWNDATAERFRTFIEDSWAGEIKASAIADQINQILSQSQSTTNVNN